MLPSYRNQSIDLQVNQLTGFYMRATPTLNGLILKTSYMSKQSDLRLTNTDKI